MTWWRLASRQRSLRSPVPSASRPAMHTCWSTAGAGGSRRMARSPLRCRQSAGQHLLHAALPLTSWVCGHHRRGVCRLEEMLASKRDSFQRSCALYQVRGAVLANNAYPYGTKRVSRAYAVVCAG